MDGIESIGTLSSQAQSVLRDLHTTVLPSDMENASPDAVADMSDLKKKELAKDFESLLLTRLFNEVKASVNASSFDEDAGSEQVHGMFWSFLAEDMADKGGFGLWQDLYQHFKDMEGTEATEPLLEKDAKA